MFTSAGMGPSEQKLAAEGEQLPTKVDSLGASEHRETRGPPVNCAGLTEFKSPLYQLPPIHP